MPFPSSVGKDLPLLEENSDLSILSVRDSSSGHEIEENKSRSRHNVEGSFLCILYFGWPNQPSSGTMIILHWYVIFMLHVV